MLHDDVRHLGNENHNRFVEAEAHERILKSFKRRKYHIDRLTGVAFFSHPVQPHGKRGELKCGRRRRMALRANYRYNKIPPAPPHPSVDRSVGRSVENIGRARDDGRDSATGAGGRGRASGADEVECGCTKTIHMQRFQAICYDADANQYSEEAP